MLNLHRSGGRRRRVLSGALAFVVGGLLASGVADAHFVLQAPPSITMQDANGSPQKLGPCGNEPPQTMTNMVTPFHPGDTVTIRLTEMIFHPGHYRVALALNSPSELPAEPKVTAGMGFPCGTVPIDPNPAFPVLVDGALVHTTPFNGPQTIQVKLPTNVSCTKCTLQVIEFMSQHGLNNPGGCFYHHCANITIQGVAADSGAGSDSGPDASVVPEGGGAAGSSGQGGSGAGSGGGGAGGLGASGAAGTIDPTGTTGGSATTTTVGTAGTGSTTTNGSVAAGGSNGAAPGSTDPGCSCTAPGQPRSSIPALAALLFLAVAMDTRRRFWRPRRSCDGKLRR